MLFVLIGITWLAVITLLVAVCRAAAEGERGRASFDELSSVSIGPRLVLSAPPERLRSRSRREDAHRISAGSRQLTRRLRTGHGAR
jgi:hypothetical protein